MKTEKWLVFLYVYGICFHHIVSGLIYIIHCDFPLSESWFCALPRRQLYDSWFDHQRFEYCWWFLLLINVINSDAGKADRCKRKEPSGVSYASDSPGSDLCNVGPTWNNLHRNQFTISTWQLPRVSSLLVSRFCQQQTWELPRRIVLHLVDAYEEQHGLWKKKVSKVKHR